MRIKPVEEITDALYEAFQNLIPQLTTLVDCPSREQLESIIRSDSSIILSPPIVSCGET